MPANPIKSLLTRRQYQVMVMSMGEGRSQPQIAQRLGVSQQAVSQRLASAHHRLAAAGIGVAATAGFGPRSSAPCGAAAVPGEA